MDTVTKVNAKGSLTCYHGKTKLHRVWEEIVIPAGPIRAALRKQMDPVLLRATRMLFGPFFKPADFNEVFQRRALVRQVMADSPRVLIPIFNFVMHGDLQATPYTTVVQRFKNMLQRVGAQDFKRHGSGGCYMAIDSKGRKRKENDVNSFWSSYLDFDRDALSDAGWRYLQRLSISTQRELSELPWQWRSHYLETFNLLGKYGLKPVNAKALNVVDSALLKCAGADSRQYFARAVVDRFSRLNDEVTAVEIDVLRDWFYDEQRTITAGTRWETLIERAFACAGEKRDKAEWEMAKYRWTPPLEPFVAEDGITVIPLSSGTELLAEGLEMANCLRSNDSYAKRAMKGESQVFSLRGVRGRASVEFVKPRAGDAWRLGQIEGPHAAAVSDPVILRVVDKIQESLKGAA